MSQQSDQWKLLKRQPMRRGPVVSDHSLNPQKLDLSSTKQQPQPHHNDDKKSDNDEYVPVESPQESGNWGIDETEGATGAWLVVGQSTEQELTATIRQLENEKSELEKEKEDLAKKKEELERENKAFQASNSEAPFVEQDLVFLVRTGYSESLLMSQGKVSQGKGEGEEGTDGAGKQGGGGGKDNQPHQKKTGLAGALRYTKKRVTGQPKSSSVAKEQDKKHFPTPAPPSPPTVKQQGEAQQQSGSARDSWQKTSPDPQQPIASASVAVQPSVEQQPDDDEPVTTTEGSTPPVVVKYQHDNITVPPQEPLLPQETDDVELSLKLTRMELERDRYMKDIENKERQIKEYEDEIITLRTQLGKSRGGGGIQSPVDQQKLVAEYEAAIKRLKDEKGELERGKEEELARQKKLEKDMEELEMKGNAEVNEVRKEMEEHTNQLEEDKQQLEAELAGAKEELQSTKEKHKQEKRKYEDQVKELNEEMNKKMEEYQQQVAVTIEHHKAEAVAKAEDKLDKEKEALLNQVEELKNDIEMRKQQIEELEEKVKVQNEEAKRRKDEAVRLETQREEHQEEVIKAQVEERVREEVDQYIRNTQKANNQSAIQQAEEHKRTTAIRLKEREEELKRHYEAILAAKEKELEETKKQLQQKEEDERAVRDELGKLLEKVEVGDGASANNSLSEEDKMRRDLEDHVARVKDLEEQMAKVESDKRELQKQLREVDVKWRKEIDEIDLQLQDKDREIHKLTEIDGKWKAEMIIHLQDKDIEIKRIIEEADYYKEQMKKTQNDALTKTTKLEEALVTYEKEMANTKETVDELSGELSKKAVEVEDLKELLEAKEQEIIKLKEETSKTSRLAHGERKQTINQLIKQVDELVKKTNTKDKQIKELVEKLQVKDAENAIYRQDFETERNDRQRLHAQYEELKAKVGNSGAQQHIADQEAIANLGEVIKGQTEEIQVLTAQVNAYSRECEKQKGLVAQNQERHKTEVQQLNEKLINEQESKQQLVNELAILRQQFDSLTASKESLLTSYIQEQAMATSLQLQLQRMREESVRMKAANKVLMEKVVASRTQEEEVASLRRTLSEFQSSWEVSRYDINLSGKELGRGGWGVVWIGQMKVAVKQIHHSIKSDTNLELLRQEINTMSQIRHPNLVHFIGAVFDGDSPDMIITEVMDTSLRRAYESKELIPHPSCRPVILSIMRDVAVGLSYLHCLPKPIIHRDVSSGNVLLQSIGRGRWRAKISDFGSAKIAQFAVTEGPGAFAYSAPEAFQSITNPDAITKQTPKMDVFSYGVLLCEAITCRFPYKYAFQDMLRQVYRISDRPRGSGSTQGYLLHALILSSCNDDPSKRPTMNEVIEQLGIIAM